jgi:cell shape-determining protein MreC
VRRIILSKVDTAKAKVGSFSKKIVNGVKSGINKIKNVFKQDPENRSALIEQLKQQKANLISMRDNNNQLREEGSYHNLKGSR